MKLGLYSYRKKSCGTNGHKCIGRNLETRTQDTSIVGCLIYFGEIELLNSRMTMVVCAQKLIPFLYSFLTGVFTRSEVNAFLKHMVPLKAPRLDGMTPIFFKLLD